jgi:hypothetical protein
MRMAKRTTPESTGHRCMGALVACPVLFFAEHHLTWPRESAKRGVVYAEAFICKTTAYE